MLYAFGFDRLAVLVGYLYFQHPEPPKGQEGPEHGVRIELRRIEAGELRGSVYSARPISLGEPIWRTDLLESVGGMSGSSDRTHHHPTFSGWDESQRVFDEELSADPVGWLGKKLSDLPGLLAQTRGTAAAATEQDLAGLQRTAPEILEVTQRLLARVRAGEFEPPPEVPTTGLIRASWL